MLKWGLSGRFLAGIIDWITQKRTGQIAGILSKKMAATGCHFSFQRLSLICCNQLSDFVRFSI
jgi:hypothetical protein